MLVWIWWQTLTRSRVRSTWFQVQDAVFKLSSEHLKILNFSPSAQKISRCNHWFLASYKIQNKSDKYSNKCKLSVNKKPRTLFGLNGTFDPVCRSWDSCTRGKLKKLKKVYLDSNLTNSLWNYCTWYFWLSVCQVKIWDNKYKRTSFAGGRHSEPLAYGLNASEPQTLVHSGWCNLQFTIQQSQSNDSRSMHNYAQLQKLL